MAPLVAQNRVQDRSGGAICNTRLHLPAPAVHLPAIPCQPIPFRLRCLVPPGLAWRRLPVGRRLERWQQGLARNCVGNNRLVFVVSAAFNGPLLHLLGAESGGFHLYGKCGWSASQPAPAKAWAVRRAARLPQRQRADQQRRQVLQHGAASLLRAMLESKPLPKLSEELARVTDHFYTLTKT